MASKIELTQEDIQNIKKLLENPSLPPEERQLIDALVAVAKAYPEKESLVETGKPGPAWIFDWQPPN